MALPNEQCAAEDVCCTSLYDMAASILDVAYTAVANCSTFNCPTPELVGYVSMGSQIADPHADFLVVSLQSVSAAPESGGGRGNHILPIYRASFQIKLLETGWPTPWGDDEQINIPDPVLVNDVTRHSMAHGEAMYRALANAMATNVLPGDAQSYRRLEPLQPIEPSGGTVGWVTNLQIATEFGRL